MIRILNALALIAMIGTATWAYSVKYETILVAEKLKKRETELRKERDAIAVLAAEWELLNRPARLAAIAKPEAGMQQLSARQVVQPKDIPATAPAKVDALDSLLTGSIPPPPPAKAAPVAAGAQLPSAKASSAKPPAKAVAAKTGAPIPLAPVGGMQKAGASKNATAKVAAPKAATAPKSAAVKSAAAKANAPKANPPTRLTPPASVGQASAPEPKRESGGLNALFKKIMN